MGTGLDTKIREIRLWRGLTQEDVAKKAKTSAATISRWEKYPSRVTVPILNNLAKILDVSPTDFLADIKPARMAGDEVVMLRGLVEPINTPFSSTVLKSLTKSPADDLAMLYVHGDAMQPTLGEGDQCLVDTADRDISAPGIYCIQLGQAAQARRLSLNPINGRINILCDNRAYDDYSDVDPQMIRVIGRIIWVGHRL
jgi:transcriptional regulator with XRE-family HTH domain